MSLSNKWLTPYQRSYDSIKAKLISSLKEKVPEISDFSEGNIFIILISMFAAIAEVLHYYIDNMARESFLPTARRYTSVYNHAKLVDYHIRCAIPSSVDVVLYNETPVETDIVIPQSTVFTSTDGKNWVSTKEVTIVQGTRTVKVPLVQRESVGPYNIQRTTSSEAVIYLGTLPSDQKYVEGSMALTIGGTPWTLVETFAYSGPLDKVYKVEPDETLKPRIIFGDGQFGMIPNLNTDITISYQLSYGKSGNVPSGSFTSIPSSITEAIDTIKISSPSAATGGSDYEDFSMLKSHIPLSVKTLGVAVTKDDYESIVKLIPGVNKAYVNYRCGKYIEVYITPDNPTTDTNDRGWGQASQTLIDTATSILNKSKVITTNIAVGSTHIAKIYIEADITGNKSFNSEDIIKQVKAALLEAYNYNTSDINKPVRLSDLYSIIDNIPLVDYLYIKRLYMLSYPKPSSYTQAELVVSQFTQLQFTPPSPEKLTLSFTSGSEYKIIFKDGESVTGNIGIPLEVYHSSGIRFSITIGENGYDDGYIYDLYLSPMNTDLIPVNYNLPIFLENTIQLTVNEVV